MVNYQLHGNLVFRTSGNHNVCKLQCWCYVLLEGLGGGEGEREREGKREKWAAHETQAYKYLHVQGSSIHTGFTVQQSTYWFDKSVVEFENTTKVTPPFSNVSP